MSSWRDLQLDSFFLSEKKKNRRSIEHIDDREEVLPVDSSYGVVVTEAKDDHVI